MYRRFRIKLHKILDRQVKVDFGFIIAMLMFVNNWIPDNVNNPVFRTLWTLVFILLLVRPWWNERYGFPYDEEESS